jgi:hypothetical protein
VHSHRVSKPPEGPQWVHKIKHDGYRLIARKRDGWVRLFTRRGYDWTARYPLIREAVAATPARSVILEWEAVYCDDAGLSVFDKLQSRAYDNQVILYAFDLLELDGGDQRRNAFSGSQSPPREGARQARGRDPAQRAFNRRRGGHIHPRLPPRSGGQCPAAWRV